MNEAETENPGFSQGPAPTDQRGPVQTVRRLHDASRERAEEARRRVEGANIRPRTGLAQDPMMDMPGRRRRKRCRYCRYRFDYRMHTNRCPECGRYRDDYPQANHGLHAMVFAAVVAVAVIAVVAGVLFARGM